MRTQQALIMAVTMLMFAMPSAMANETATQPTKAPDPIASTYRPLTGKLFFNDLERERLDKARKDGVQVVDSEVVNRTPTLNGMVRESSSRKTTYWVDGKARRVGTKERDPAIAPNMVGATPTVTLRASGEGAPPSGDGQTTQRKTKSAQSGVLR